MGPSTNLFASLVKKIEAIVSTKHTKIVLLILRADWIWSSVFKDQTARN